jgi:hypothetical protein
VQTTHRRTPHGRFPINLTGSTAKAWSRIVVPLRAFPSAEVGALSEAVRLPTQSQGRYSINLTGSTAKAWSCIVVPLHAFPSAEVGRCPKQ